jgi:hypothetical protein
MAKAKRPPVQEDESAKSELIRRFKANPAVFIGTVVILIIVIVAFVFLPALVPAAGGWGEDLVFGYYDKTPISYRRGNYFARMYDYYTELMRGSYSEEDAYFVNFQIWQSAYNSAVIQTAILREMEQAGYEPPKELVDREVAQQYLAVYRQETESGKTALWRSVKETITTEKYLQDQYELLKPAGEEEFVVSMASPQRRVEGTAFSLLDYPETEVRAFAAGNAALFRSVHLSRITINAGEREARQILSSVTEGTSSFEDAARNHSQDAYADRGGDMGVQMAYELSTVVRDEGEREKILALKKGELSGLVSEGETWMFFRAEDDSLPADPGDSSQLEKIRSYILLFERGRMDDYFIRRAGEFRAKAALGGIEGFSAAVEEAELRKFSLGPLAINYGNQNFFPPLAGVEGFTEAALSSFAVTDSFWKSIFFTPLGTISEPLVLGDQVLLFLPVEELEPEEYALETLKNSFENLVLQSNRDINSFFIQSPKLQDRFWETYSRYFIGG